MSRPLTVYIDLRALRHNYAQIKQKLGSAKALAVIKANAYGHGVKEVANALSTDVAGFGLLEIEYACALRQSGIQVPILLLEGVFEESELALCRQYDFMVAIHNMAQIDWLINLPSGPLLDVFVKINSGMNRLGFAPDLIDQVMSKLQNAPVKSICLMTHFATADEADKGVEGQWSVFERVRQQYPELPICTANTAALFNYPKTHGQWVRPGIALYGSSPFSNTSAQELGLRPVMHFLSEIIAIHEVQPGEIVGYGATFTVDKPMWLGIVACGYGDGYPRHASTGTPLMVEKKRCRLIGRVSMDMLCVDISEIPEAKVGSPVELWGSMLSIDEVAHHAGTIGYELMCAITPRVKRQYSAIE